MKEGKLIKDEYVLLNLEIEVKRIIERAPWEQIQYTVPGSMEKIIEVKGGLVNAFKRIQKGIEFINYGRRNEDNQESEKA